MKQCIRESRARKKKRLDHEKTLFAFQELVQALLEKTWEGGGIPRMEEEPRCGESSHGLYVRGDGGSEKTSAMFVAREKGGTE